MKRGAGPAEEYGARAAASDIDAKQLKAMLTYPSEWGPSDWGEHRCPWPLACSGPVLSAEGGETFLGAASTRLT